VIPAAALSRPGNPTTAAVYLSDLNWVSATNDWGPVERDGSNGEQDPSDSKTISLGGVPYAKGLGVHAASTVVYALNGGYTRFLTDVGVDDEVGDNGTVNFQVYLDGTLAYESGTLRGSSATSSVDLNVSGKNELKLVVTNAGDNAYFDHADWAGARLLPVAANRLALPTRTTQPDNATVSLYPNPAHTAVNVSLQLPQSQAVHVTVLDALGRQVTNITQTAPAGHLNLRVPLDGIAKGIYLLKVEYGKIRSTQRLLVEK
jgi:hypothetical protein